MLQTLTLSSFVDRDMFMRYSGGGIGHTATSQTKISNDDDAMDVDDDSFTADADQGGNIEKERDLEDSHLLDELRHIVQGEMAGDQDEAEELMDGSNAKAVNEDGEDEEDALSETNSEIGDDDDLGPEDGEDEVYLDTGYGAL
jgi:hypothetical protein